jgi:nucleotide-binding universal stress UspA family protein
MTIQTRSSLTPNYSIWYVTIIRRLTDPAASKSRTGGESMVPEIKKILYATDLSKNSSYAFYHAINLARRFDAMITILHAIEPIPVYVEAYVVSVAEKIEKEDREKTVAHIRNLLQEFCKKVESQTGAPCLVLVSNILIRVGHPVEEILKAADEEGCDTIVLGSHGKGFLKQAFLGSVSSGVLHRSKKPVFIIPIPSEKESGDWSEI